MYNNSTLAFESDKLVAFILYVKLPFASIYVGFVTPSNPITLVLRIEISLDAILVASGLLISYSVPLIFTFP